MNKIKFWRIERGLSQIEFAEATGFPRYKIQLIEQGVAIPTPEELQIIATTLGLKLKDGKLIWSSDNEKY